MPMSNRKTNRALKTTFTTLEMMETTIGVLEFCIPMNQPCMAKSDMEAGAAQIRAKKYSAASARAPSLPCISPSENRPTGLRSRTRSRASTMATDMERTRMSVHSRRLRAP